MGEKTAISWTNHTFNPWWGCTKISPGCKFCYADKDAERYGWTDAAAKATDGKRFRIWGDDAKRRFFGDSHWDEPLKWNREAEKAGKQAYVFCASFADVLEDRPDLVEPRARLCRLIERTPWLIWQLVTKRPENWSKLMPLEWAIHARPNVWLIATVETQEYAERLIHVAQANVVVRGISYEPALGPVNFRRIEYVPNGIVGNTCFYDAFTGWVTHLTGRQRIPAMDWAIIGGESGAEAEARKFDLAWGRRVQDDADQAYIEYRHRVYLFWKQLGVHAEEDFAPLPKIGRKNEDMKFWAADIQRQEFPPGMPVELKMEQQTL